MPPKDVISKKLLKHLAVDMANYLFDLEVTQSEIVETEFQRVEDRRADLVIRVQAPEHYLLHIEIQNQNDSEMPHRMLRYCSDILSAHPGEALRQYVVYTGKDRLRMADSIHTHGLYYRYGILNMRRLDCRVLLEEDTPESLIMAVLCDFKGRPAKEVLREILTRLQTKAGDDDARFREYLFMLEVLASNRNLEPVVQEVETMLSTTKLSDLPSYHLGMERGMERGMEQGEEKGRLRGMSNSLILLLETRFHETPDEIRQRIQDADEAQLTKWMQRLVTATHLTEIFATRDRS